MHDIVVIGAPVGGGAAVAQLISDLPFDFEAAVFVVLHAARESPILLADVLNAPGRMRAAEAIDGEPIERRRIYVGVSGAHLLLEKERVRTSATPGNKPHQPSIDVLFTSAATVFQNRVIGVLLLHAREDGIVGLDAIRKAGGRTITHKNAQMPEPPAQPETAELLSDDHVELEEIASCLVAYVAGNNGNCSTAVKSIKKTIPTGRA